MKYLRPMRKKILTLLLTVLVILIAWQWELVKYGIAQGNGQLHIVRNAIPLQELLNDPQFPDSLRVKVEMIEKVKKFSCQTLGLAESSNYSTYYDQNGQISLWNVSGAEEFALKPKTWWFPIVGAVPYKGFFEKEKAVTLVEELEAEGWDARMRPVSGWSTLGWFSDPVLSSMLSRSEGQLAELIIHELTHETLFVSGEVDFNENLASFVGEQGAIMFLKQTYGNSSSELNTYIQQELDSKKFINHMLIGTTKLDSLYKNLNDESPQTKRNLKKAMIQRICHKVDTIDFFQDHYRHIFDRAIPNNAYFMSYLRYYSSGDSLNNLLNKEHNNNLKEFIQSQIEIHEK